MDTEQRVHSLLAEHLCVEPERVVGEANLCDDLGADSLDTIELAMAIEEAFKIEVSDEECANWKTVADIVATAQAAKVG